jgi:hypothetical protein
LSRLWAWTRSELQLTTGPTGPLQIPDSRAHHHNH